jgi:hypothetical protein
MKAAIHKPWIALISKLACANPYGFWACMPKLSGGMFWMLTD